ncbi:YqjF family protein [Kribbella sp. NPDC049227]|uniref:YqjF family protein n=1 Tax=Kribbella sp. NPDC049227 TaxID=3364113 RepID=UPI003712E4A6
MDAIWPDAPELERPWILRQRWLDLTFLHWALDPVEVAHFFPAGTRPDTFEGRTYVGLVPFRMTGTGFPHGPAVPVLGSFLETNIRLYSVDDSGRRGVVFLSLDADRLAVVAAARTIFGLPYRWAQMTHTQVADQHTYTSVLRWPGVHATSTITVAIGSPVASDPLTDFLTARWGLHTPRARRTWYLPNHHPVWSFRTATVRASEIDGLFRSVGLAEPTRPPDHVLHSPGVPATFALPVRI